VPTDSSIIISVREIVQASFDNIRTFYS